ncbi:hypothetical protein [Sulfurovum sp. NBC37-1]|uniref:hypothetical protein n=1 Tax=Sulfurovum sp. (strain NBC37-1) TaxID=387093 RepID=UPI0001587C84|nr:hypothetical protein [Sulfurovum sp. NBC37-1]BAF72570.1 hypothetical protein SUN_1620 [Sulfurovum sp. NBC37-1]
MYYLTAIDRCRISDLENELRDFFHRVHHVKRRLQRERDRLELNRIQRARCKANLMDIEKLEYEFHAISYRDDVRELYRKVHRFVKLDHERLMDTFGRETVNRCSLFIAL